MLQACWFFRLVICYPWRRFQNSCLLLAEPLESLWINEYVHSKLLPSFHHISLRSNYIQKEDQHTFVMPNHFKGTQTSLKNIGQAYVITQHYFPEDLITLALTVILEKYIYSLWISFNFSKMVLNSFYTIPSTTIKFVLCF